MHVVIVLHISAYRRKVDVYMLMCITSFTYINLIIRILISTF